MLIRLSSKLLLSLCFLSISALAQSQSQILLKNGDLSGWEERVFDGQTTYQAAQGQLRADANASGSGYFLEKTFAIDANSQLSWSWQALDFPDIGDEKTKAGDDFAARVYVIKEGFLGLANAKSIVYVWSQQYPTNESWANPYTDKARQVVVSNAQIGQSQSVSRNIQADFERYFGIEVDSIDAIAIMTDSDQSQSQASALYGDITLTQ